MWFYILCIPCLCTLTFFRCLHKKYGLIFTLVWTKTADGLNENVNPLSTVGGAGNPFTKEQSLLEWGEKFASMI